MRGDNQPFTLGFILLGVSGQQQREYFFFILFLFIYPNTLIGNLLIILAICVPVCSDTHLHNPMYFFLANPSFVDIFFSSVTIPKMLANHVLGSKAISFRGCLTQMYSMLALGNTDSYILAAVACDHAVAISRPLYYTTIMSPRTCFLLVVGNANPLPPHILLTAGLSFCGNKEVANFYCDIVSLLKLSCSDIHFNVKMTYLGVGVFSVPLLYIIISFIHVFSTVLQVPCTKGVLKAFSTCGSHLTVVALYYGTVMGMYFCPLSSYSLKDAVITVMYIAVTPMLNPFIYSLRNQDMKAALGKLFSKKLITNMRSIGESISHQLGCI
ncbi:LOW QUALITY PROTEIN: olfactory receptor 1A1-like [Mustela erminea]|uniref:LOW QUALITY PROTEIN: olfactory receptor 1A1-like n=1 Tax=Mustela erminea TaxID=36723 RepID=UPI001387002D|nr:LOW QUALITY PROTEIN: olfactory receptor 1A1-like [Mustela erminea]